MDSQPRDFIAEFEILELQSLNCPYIFITALSEILIPSSAAQSVPRFDIIYLRYHGVQRPQRLESQSSKRPPAFYPPPPWSSSKSAKINSK